MEKRIAAWRPPGKIIREKLDITPGFDMLHYMEIAGLPRLEQEEAARSPNAPEGWAGALRAYRFDLGRRKGYVLLYLDESVENDVEAAWQRSPSEGFSLHNLAIALVMGAAGQVVPEVADGGCAPLPRPDRDMLRQFKTLGLEWNPAGTVNRQYAVFTPMPYAGGCAVCMLRDSCPKSRA
jgi:hypothetical protein